MKSSSCSIRTGNAWSADFPALRRFALLGAVLAALAGCGGGQDDEYSPDAAPVAAVSREQALAATDLPASREEAARFLSRATMGPTTADTDRLMAIGYGAWLDEQVAKTPAKVRSYVDSNLALYGSVGLGDVINGVWYGMFKDSAQLRQRVAFALSEIFVISLVDGSVHNNPRGAGSFYDMLAEKGLGNYRDLLQSVALHPMMGQYLSHRSNQKGDPVTGRVPDENFARESMQLFSIGLHQLNADGTLRLDANGKPIDTLGPDDIAGLAKVFTGWSWSCPGGPTDNCFKVSSPRNTGDPDSEIKPMIGYPKYHSIEEKRFLGVTVPAQSTADPAASLKVAIDTLYKHANAGPFISRQLIQRLVTSNPSPKYVADVVAKFNNNGAGVRGDMATVVRTILLHAEARAQTTSSGKVREPILRLTAFVRAFPYSSVSGKFKVGPMESESQQLGQTPMYARSVFNFFRPGFTPPGSQTEALGLVAPEMQLVNDTTVAGYVTFMRWSIEKNSLGTTDAAGKADVQLDFSKELSLATDPAGLVSRIKSVLLYGVMSSSFQNELVGILSRMPIPALAADKSNQAAVDTAKRKRVNAALLLTIASPEFVVQK